MTAATSKPPSQERWDRVGILASTACIVHCVIAPAVFLFLPGLAGVWTHPVSHALVALLVLPLAGTVIRSGFRVHGRKWIVAVALLGTGFIVAGSVLPYVDTVGRSPGAMADAASACPSCCPQFVEGKTGEQRFVLPAASVVTVIGSLFLISSHLGNLLACRCCRASS